MTHLLNKIHEELKWPAASEIMQPSGAGPRMLAELVQRKLQIPLSRIERGLRVHAGILPRNSNEDETIAPIAIVCEFNKPVSASTIREAHRLAWNFSHSPMLVTLEPHQIRAWSCYEKPSFSQDESFDFEIDEVRSEISNEVSLADQATIALHWIELITGRFFERFESRFKRDHCADRLLLKNLQEVRKKLIEEGLDQDTSHDLLARIIFIQFLIDRKDSNGKSALSPSKLENLHKKGLLSTKYVDLEEILLSYDDTYSLFYYLNKKFNGDLFPGSGKDKKRQDEEWQQEKSKVTEDHLRTLADFVGGRLNFQNKQGLLWRDYSFDVIPLEFISSIYEEFVTKRDKKKKRATGTVYTPPHLVDFILDGVLPWRDTDWDLKILDPACGSGIFLVKSFQRLVWRWKTGNRRKPDAAILRQLLERHLFGVDKDEHAVRVASFSLYLAMCDEIDPKYYWSHVKFPSLRGKTIIASDFFAEDIHGFQSKEDGEQYDVIIGNVPWGRNTVGDSDMKMWKDQGWEVSDNNIGPMFLPKTAALAKKDGVVSLLQPSGMLTNNLGTAARFRKKFFETYNVEEIVNLSALRFGLYKGAIGPSCIVTFGSKEPDNEPFTYIASKELKSIDDDLRIVVEPYDVHSIYQDDAAVDSTIWSTFAWGGHREYTLIRHLKRNQTFNTLLEDKYIIKIRGIDRGDRKRTDKIKGKKILETEDFPENSFHYLYADELPDNIDPKVHSRASTDYSAFSIPQMIVKQGWKADTRRFKAVIVRSIKNEGILCSKSYTSLHQMKGPMEILEASWLVLNSSYCTFYLMLTSGRMAQYRPEALVRDILNIPIPEICPGISNGIQNYEELDARVREAFGFSDIEWTLIEDMFDYTLPDFKGNADSPGRRPTRLPASGNGVDDSEDFLKNYADYCMRVLKAGFGEDKRISATIFSEDDRDWLPVRLVAIHLDDIIDNEICIENISGARLRDLLLKWDAMLASQTQSALYQRVGKVYDIVVRGGRKTPTAYLIKPDRRRYWTRTAAIRDADNIFADIMTWRTDRQS